MELNRWLEENGRDIVSRWEAEIAGRGDGVETMEDTVLDSFLHHLVDFLSHAMGPTRAMARDLWEQVCYLYGSFALQRGLAAGEVVEEFHLLRETILKALLLGEGNQGPWEGWARDLLALNRILDAGMAQASIAYVDELFFAHLQGSGVPEGVSPEVEVEIERQLEALRKEMRE